MDSSVAFCLLVLWHTIPILGTQRANAGQRGPGPGDVYCEYATHNGGNLAWRVTDPNARPERARQKLPNPVLEITINDLKHAVRAEALFDRWGGHLRTTEKRIRFNENAWITIPEISTTPGDQRAEYYYSQDNPIIDVPLCHLREGINSFEGTCGVLEDYGWGQWGLYSLIVRVYYDPKLKDHPTGTVVSPASGETINENPTVKVDPKAGPGVARVDVLAWYDGFDENGDGVFQDWHRCYHQPLRGAPADISEHVGTSWRAPYEVVWNTRWVPNQLPNSIKLIARIQDSRGIWSCTNLVEGITLSRKKSSVTLYCSADVPEQFGVRVGRTRECTILIPDGAPLHRATEAAMALRTWHGWDGHHEPLNLNGHTFPMQGKNHHYDFDIISVPTSVLRLGLNKFRIHSKTEHHMLEVLWPGPALIVRYQDTNLGSNHER